MVFSTTYLINCMLRHKTCALYTWIESVKCSKGFKEVDMKRNEICMKPSGTIIDLSRFKNLLYKGKHCYHRFKNENLFHTRFTLGGTSDKTCLLDTTEQKSLSTLKSDPNSLTLSLELNTLSSLNCMMYRKSIGQSIGSMVSSPNIIAMPVGDEWI